MKKFIIILIGSFLTLHASRAQTIYVNVSNNTGIEDGTQAHPFNTINEGLQASQNGNSIAVASGTYLEDTLLIEKCVFITGNNRSSTIVKGTFILSSKLDTIPVSISNLWCQNVMHSDSGYTQTPLTVKECGLQSLNDHTRSVKETGRILIQNNVVTDSIHISNTACAARREVINCESGGGLWISCVSSQGNIRISGNTVEGYLMIQTIAHADTVFVTENTIQDNLVVKSVASGPGVFTDNSIGSGVHISAVSHQGFEFMFNRVIHGKVTGEFRALSTSVIASNTIQNGGIDMASVAADLIINSNTIHSQGSSHGIRLKTVAGGTIEFNTITLPYLVPSGLSFENDSVSVCGINVQSVAFGGMKRNKVTGGAYGVYLKAIASNDINQNEIEDSHYGLYLSAISGKVDSNRVEQCIADGMILDYPSEDTDTNSIRVNHNIVRNSGGHGIWIKGNALMGNLEEPGTGFNIIKNNVGYDLYIETPSTFIDTIWAQNNEWSHSTEAEVGLIDIYDASDDPAKARVIFSPVVVLGFGEKIEEAFDLWPNPGRGRFQIRNSRFQKEIEKVDLVELNGRVVQVLFEGKSESGVLEFDVSHLPEGIYFCRLYSGGYVVTKKMIILL